MVSDDDGFDEIPQSGFGLDASSLVAFMRSALNGFAHRCALTGLGFPGEAVLPHPHLDVVLIRPLALGGQAVAGNVLVLETHAARAFRRGGILVDPHYRVAIAEPDLVDPGLAVHLVAGRRLFLPPERRWWPQIGALAAHARFFGHSL